MLESYNKVSYLTFIGFGYRRSVDHVCLVIYDFFGQGLIEKMYTLYKYYFTVKKTPINTLELPPIKQGLTGLFCGTIFGIETGGNNMSNDHSNNGSSGYVEEPEYGEELELLYVSLGKDGRPEFVEVEASSITDKQRSVSQTIAEDIGYYELLDLYEHLRISRTETIKVLSSSITDQQRSDADHYDNENINHHETDSYASDQLNDFSKTNERVKLSAVEQKRKVFRKNMEFGNDFDSGDADLIEWDDILHSIDSPYYRQFVDKANGGDPSTPISEQAVFASCMHSIACSANENNLANCYMADSSNVSPVSWYSVIQGETACGKSEALNIANYAMNDRIRMIKKVGSDKSFEKEAFMAGGNICFLVDECGTFLTSLSDKDNAYNSGISDIMLNGYGSDSRIFLDVKRVAELSKELTDRRAKIKDSDLSDASRRLSQDLDNKISALDGASKMPTWGIVFTGCTTAIGANEFLTPSNADSGMLGRMFIFSAGDERISKGSYFASPEIYNESVGYDHPVRDSFMEMSDTGKAILESRAGDKLVPENSHLERECGSIINRIQRTCESLSFSVDYRLKQKVGTVATLLAYSRLKRGDTKILINEKDLKVGLAVALKTGEAVKSKLGLTTSYERKNIRDDLAPSPLDIFFLKFLSFKMRGKQDEIYIKTLINKGMLTQNSDTPEFSKPVIELINDDENLKGEFECIEAMLLGVSDNKKDTVNHIKALLLDTIKKNPLSYHATDKVIFRKK